MGNAFVVQYETSSEKADENQRLVEAVFAELAAKRRRACRTPVSAWPTA